MPRKITIVLWLYSSNKVPQKELDDMTAHVGNDQSGTWRTKTNEVLEQFKYYYKTISAGGINRTKEGDMANTGMP
jgi:hypothetical protein